MDLRYISTRIMNGRFKPVIHFKYLLAFVLCCAALLWVDAEGAQAQSNDGVAFTIRYSRGVYTVAMRPTFTPNAPALTLASQVTVKVPHVAGGERFAVVALDAHVPATRWAVRSRVNSPEEAPGFDYISFEVAFPTGNFAAIQWQAGQEVRLFSFRNANGCAGAAYLINQHDPFVAPNSVSTNPGNQIDILGGPTGNLFIGNYDEGKANCFVFDGVTPVLFSSRRVTTTAQGNRVCWSTVVESDLLGFHLLRQAKHDAELMQLTETLMPAQKSGQPSGATYCRRDADSPGQAVQYWLETVELDGTRARYLFGAPQQELFLPALHALHRLWHTLSRL